MNKQKLAQALLAAKSKEAGENAAEERTESASQETAEDKGKSLPLAGQNSAQGVPAPKKPNGTQPASTNLSSSKPRAPFQSNLVKHPKGKGGKAVIPPKKAAGGIYFPKAKTR